MATGSRRRRAVGGEAMVRLRRFDVAVLDGVGDELGGFVKAELFLQGGEIILDGLGVDLEALGDGLRVLAAGEGAEDIAFARRQVDGDGAALVDHLLDEEARAVAAVIFFAGEDAGDGKPQRGEIGAFHDEAVDAEGDGFTDEVALLVGGNEKPARALELRAGLANEVEAAAVGEHPVDDGEVGLFAEERGGTFGDGAAIGEEAEPEVFTHQVGEELADHGVVFDEDDAGGGFHRHDPG